MKKFISALLALTFALSFNTLGATAKEVNLNDRFEAAAISTQFIEMSQLGAMGNVSLGESFSPNTIFSYTNMWTDYDDQYGLEENSYKWTDENGVTHIEYWEFAIPAEIFEAEMRKYFVIDDALIEALHSIEQYNSENNTYRTHRTGIGDSTTYVSYGYTDNADDTYTYYAFFIDRADAGYVPSEDEVLFKDYTISGGNYYEILHSLRITFDSLMRFLSYEKNIEVPDADTLIRPEGTEIEAYLDDASVFSYDDVFPNETVVCVRPIEDETGVSEIQNALPNTTIVFAFDITASKDNESLQPSGAVCVTYYLPDDYDPKTESFNFYYISDDGNAEATDCVIVEDTYTVTITCALQHFSKYAMVRENIPQSQITVTIDETYTYIHGIKAGTTANDLTALCAIKNGISLSDNDLIGTGCDIKVNNYEGYTAIVMGDVSGDGNINSTDFMQVRRQFLQLYEMDDAQQIAADVNGDGKINSTDFMQIRKHFLNLFDLYA